MKWILTVLALCASLLLSEPVAAQGETVEAWYQVQSGERMEVVRARAVVIESSRRGAVVRAGRQRFSFDGAVSVAFLSVYERGQTPPKPSSESGDEENTPGRGGKTVFSLDTETTYYDDGSVEHKETRTKTDPDGSTSTTTTTTTTEPNEDGTTTTTTETTTTTTE